MPALFLNRRVARWRIRPGLAGAVVVGVQNTRGEPKLPSTSIRRPR